MNFVILSYSLMSEPEGVCLDPLVRSLVAGSTRFDKVNNNCDVADVMLMGHDGVGRAGAGYVLKIKGASLYQK